MKVSTDRCRNAKSLNKEDMMPRKLTHILFGASMRLILTTAALFLVPALVCAQPSPLKEETNSHLKLFFYHSPEGIDWSSPRDLARSVVRNEFSKKRRSIGHVSVQIDCGQATESIWTGMSDDSVDYRKLVFKEGYGLGVLFENVPGRLENREKLENEFDGLAENGRIYALDVLISHSTCERMQTYLTEFRERGLSKWYGLPNRPRYEEGAGCSAFAVSFLEIGGLMREEWETSWMRELKVPERWIGGPETDRDVSFRRLYFLRKSWNHWGEDQAGVRTVHFWDPDLMHDWAKRMMEQEAIQNFLILREGPVPTIVWDARELPTPDGPIWVK